MPHDHEGHGHCHDEGHDHDHDHDHETGEGPADNLYSQIDLDNTIALNLDESTPIRNAIKPWNLRNDETKWIESDADDQIIVRVLFTGSVKLRSVMLKCGPEDHTPERMLLYATEESLDFSDIADRPASQEIAIPRTQDVAEHIVKASKFSNISTLTLFFPAAQGADTLRISYIGLRGTWTELKREPVVSVYELHANLADHQKIQGLDGVGSHIGS
ncbi:DUF1000-domain-containing protein [Schizopora paradoxa]|uniref:DUF1000-domain-containing protein n=1 Tax=Schizopora paradoxa TaxID=27342 RepID=A0A0H2R1W6_9AGAM|nr:DUF1000-domain-containing protein [Schizopora paradoxa]